MADRPRSYFKVSAPDTSYHSGHEELLDGRLFFPAGQANPSLDRSAAGGGSDCAQRVDWACRRAPASTHAQDAQRLSAGEAVGGYRRRAAQCRAPPLEGPPRATTAVRAPFFFLRGP